MRTQELEILRRQFCIGKHTKRAQKSKKNGVGRYCGTYTGKVTEIPIFTLHLHHSETSGVAAAGKRRLLASSNKQNYAILVVVSSTLQYGVVIL